MGLFDFLSLENRLKKRLTTGSGLEKLKVIEEIEQGKTWEPYIPEMLKLLEGSDENVALEAAVVLARQRIDDGAELLKKGYLTSKDQELKCKILYGINNLYVPGLEEQVMKDLEATAIYAPEECLGVRLGPDTDLEHSLFFQCCNYLKSHFAEEYYPRIRKVWERVVAEPSLVRGYLVAETLMVLSPEEVVPMVEDMIKRDKDQSKHGVEMLSASGPIARERLLDVVQDSSRINFMDTLNITLDIAGKAEIPLLLRQIQRLETSLRNNKPLKGQIIRLQNPAVFERCGTFAMRLAKKIIEISDSREDIEALRKYTNQDHLLHYHDRFRRVVEDALG